MQSLAPKPKLMLESCQVVVQRSRRRRRPTLAGTRSDGGVDSVDELHKDCGRYSRLFRVPLGAERGQQSDPDPVHLEAHLHGGCKRSVGE